MPFKRCHIKAHPTHCRPYAKTNCTHCPPARDINSCQPSPWPRTLPGTPISFRGTCCPHYIVRYSNDTKRKNAISFWWIKGPWLCLSTYVILDKTTYFFNSNGPCHGKGKFEYAHSQIMCFCCRREINS